MPFAAADIESVRAAIRAAIAGSGGSPLPARAWEWVVGGQFLRARLLVRLSKARRVPRDRWTAFAAAIELVHAASLLHDDVIDGALLRRHAPALWTVYGPRLAILAGDYLLAVAFGLLATGGNAFHAPLAALLAAARTTCTAEMRRELAPAPERSPRNRALLDHARGKTGPLFALAAAGLLPPSAAAERRAFWEKTGAEIGLVYQIADDLADATLPATATGKTMGRDAARHLPTTASCSTIPGLRNRIGALVAASASLSIPTPAEKTALARFLSEDLAPAIGVLP